MTKPMAQPENESAFWDGQRKAAQHPRSPHYVDVPSPSRRSRIVGRCVVAAVIGGMATFLFFGCIARAAEPERSWVVWLVDEDRPWLSRKGLPASATGATACSISLTEITRAVPSGTRVACVDTSKRKE